jgi:uncharacterized hydrophobic protein (TIGR00271 family)
LPEKRGEDVADGSIGVWIGNDLDIALQLRWGLRLAKARQLNLVVFEHTQGNESLAIEVALNDQANTNTSPLFDEVLKLIESSDDLCAGVTEDEEDSAPADDNEQLITVRLKQLCYATPRAFRELMLRQVQESKLKVLTLARREHETKDAEIVAERRQFLRYSPCEVVFCFGIVEDKEDLKITVGAASGTHGSAAMKFARDISRASNVNLTATRVNPDVGPESEKVGARRLGVLLARALGPDTDGIHRTVIVDNNYNQGIQRYWEASTCDLIVMGASRVGLWGSRITGSTGSKIYKSDKTRAVVVVSAGSPIKGRFVGAVESKLDRLVPQIERENRIALVERLQSNSNLDFDFIALMVLATTIAAIGLVQNSAAVVIGAMLVAPLMTPLLGLGLALVQGNVMLAKISVRSVLFGIFVALLVGVLVGLAIGFDQPSAQMLARGGPSLLDLFVAFASGLAAAYASSRPGLLAALPGVAIAAALVPPIATSGLALSQGNYDLAFNAFLLFVVNMFTIVLAAVLTLWMVGFRSFRKTSRWIIYSGISVMAAVLTLGIFLSLRTEVSTVNDALLDNLADLKESVQLKLGNDFQLEEVEVVYEDFVVQLNLGVSGGSMVSKEKAEEIRKVASETFDRPVQVRLIIHGENGIKVEIPLVNQIIRN